MCDLPLLPPGVFSSGSEYFRNIPRIKTLLHRLGRDEAWLAGVLGIPVRSITEWLQHRTQAYPVSLIVNVRIGRGWDIDLPLNVEEFLSGEIRAMDVGMSLEELLTMSLKLLASVMDDEPPSRPLRA